MAGDGGRLRGGGGRGGLRSSFAQIAITVTGASLVAVLGIDRLPSVLPWGKSSDSTVITSQASTTVGSTPGMTGPSSVTSTTTSGDATPTTTNGPTGSKPKVTPPSAVSALSVAKFSNDALSAAESSGRPTWSVLSLTMAAIMESTNHDNAAQASVGTSTTPTVCSWADDTLRFMDAGTCNLRISIPEAPKKARYKAFEKVFKINVAAPVISSPGTYSPQERLNDAPTARGNFLTYGKEVPTELAYGDVLGYWHMKMSVALRQPDPSLGTARCFRVYVRYQSGNKQSYNDFTDDIVGCSETTGLTGPKVYCVNFQPAWYKRNASGEESLDLRDSAGNPMTDKYAKVKFSRIGWGLEWSWDAFNTPSRTTAWTKAEKDQVQSEALRPAVDVQEVAAGKCQ